MHHAREVRRRYHIGLRQIPGFDEQSDEAGTRRPVSLKLLFVSYKRYSTKYDCIYRTSFRPKSQIYAPRKVSSYMTQ